MVKDIIGLGGDVNVSDVEGRSPFHHAVFVSVKMNDPLFEIEKILFNEGASPNAVDIYGRTPLHYCFANIENPYDTSEVDPVETLTNLLGLPNC